MSRVKHQARSRSSKLLILSWLASGASIVLLYYATKAVLADLAGFRSCSSNVGLAIHSCGKNGLDIGDIILFGLFFLCSCLVVSLVTASWRMSKKDKT